MTPDTKHRVHQLMCSTEESLKAAVPNHILRVPFILLGWYVSAKILYILFILPHASAVLPIL